LIPMAFRFKEFMIEDDQSTMRVGSDAVLLGAWAEISDDQAILEVGTGCGVISLMLAQRSTAVIDAIDIDQPSVIQAKENFEKSRWKKRLSAFHISFQDFFQGKEHRYDHIITNPPFFRKSLKSPEQKNNLSKHELHLGYEDLLEGTVHLLKPDGRLSLILPVAESRIFCPLAEEKKLFLSRATTVVPRVTKQANRILMEFSFRRPPAPDHGNLVVREKSGSYTTEYISFTEPYYFSLK
jgi:tRNA1Val (adenine37-N6)-methyltransferase